MTDQNEDVIMGERDAEGSQLSRGGIQAIQSTDIRAQVFLSFESSLVHSIDVDTSAESQFDCP
jgi:hypothetical protein